ncbi:GTP-binding protein, partial [Pseudomonas corrugata]
YKGVLSIAGEPRRLVFQGVLKLYGFDWDTEWTPNEARESVIVFIVDELPEEKIRAGFEAALI